jgi:putative transposase
MVNYRRNRQIGGTYFFTVTLRNRQSNFLITYINELRSALNYVKKKRPYLTKGFVILPEHLHMIWELPLGDSDYSTRWRQTKALFTRSLIKEGVILEKDARGEYCLWQRRYWEHTIRNDKDFENHMNYIHYNPVKHKLVENADDWKFSSFHYYVEQGIITKDWGSNFKESGNEFGE